MATIVRREASDGSVSYQARIRVRGERPRSRTFKRMTDAKAWAAKAESDMGHGTYVPTTADRRRTLAELVDKFTAEYLPVKPNNKDGAKVAAMLAWWKDRAGFVTLDKLAPQTIAGYRAELSSQRSKRGGGVLSGATVNRYLAALSAVCKWAWKELGWLPSNPVLAITKRSEGAGIVRFLSDDERKSLLSVCRASTDPNVYCAVVLALATGARRSNIYRLRWEDVDLDRLTLHFPDTKNGQPRRVPIVGPAVAAIREQFERDPTGTGWVFKGARDDAPANLDRVWMRARDAAGLVGFRFHDLRHTTASYLTMNGASLAEVAEALGHRTLVMARRYSHMTGDHTRSVLERMADKFLGDEE